MIKERILPKLLLLNTRIVVETYTALSLPLYVAIQRPWRVLQQNKLPRALVHESRDRSYRFWKRNGQPIQHPFNYHLCNSFKEVIQAMRKNEDLDRPRVSYREVYSEKIKLNDKGEPIKQDGRLIKQLKLADHFEWLTTREIFTRVDNISRGFASLGIKPREKVIIYAETRLEWLLVALSLFELDATIVTLFSNLGNDGLIHGMKQTQCKYMITTIDLLDRIGPLLHETSNIEKIIYIRHCYQKNQSIENKHPERIEMLPLDEVEERGKNLPALDIPLPQPDDLALVMYTSGTTGTPKAVMLQHRQVKASLQALTSNVNDLADEAPRHVYASFLPLAHIMGLTFELFLFAGGVRIGYSSPLTLTDNSPAHLPAQKGDLRLLRPTVLITVPLMLDRIVKEIYLLLSTRSPMLPTLFTYLMDYKIKWTKRGFDTPIINRLICKRIQEQFGGNLEFIISGGAPLNIRTQELIKAALNVNLMQGYGSTETTGGIVGMMRFDHETGIAGYPLEGVQIKLASWPEGGYNLEDRPNPRGEILVGGDCVAQGYYKLDEETKQSFSVSSDGIRWFHSGDIGEIFPNGSIRVIDRKKDLAKLPNGEYISLGKIESTLKTLPLVENVCICVSDLENDICALITPNDKALRRLAHDLNKSELSREQLCVDPKVNHTVMNEILNLGKTAGLHRKETPIKIHLCSEEWLPDNKLLTAAFKLKRQNVLKHYQRQITRMFEELALR